MRLGVVANLNSTDDESPDDGTKLHGIAWAAYDAAVIAHQRAELTWQLASRSRAGTVAAAEIERLRVALEEATRVRAVCLAGLIDRRTLPRHS
jgi:hypothetical protein